MAHHHISQRKYESSRYLGFAHKRPGYEKLIVLLSSVVILWKVSRSKKESTSAQSAWRLFFIPRNFLARSPFTSSLSGFHNDSVQRVCPHCSMEVHEQTGTFNLRVKSVRLGEDENFECQVSPGSGANNKDKTPLRHAVHVNILGEWLRPVLQTWKSFSSRVSVC